MDNDIDQMVAHNIMLVEIVVQRKANVGYGTTWKPSQPQTCNLFQVKIRYSDMSVVFNVAPVIKDKWASQGVWIDGESKNTQKQEH